MSKSVFAKLVGADFDERDDPIVQNARDGVKAADKAAKKAAKKAEKDELTSLAFGSASSKKKKSKSLIAAFDDGPVSPSKPAATTPAASATAGKSKPKPDGSAVKRTEEEEFEEQLARALKESLSLAAPAVISTVPESIRRAAAGPAPIASKAPAPVASPAPAAALSVPASKVSSEPPKAASADGTAPPPTAVSKKDKKKEKKEAPAPAPAAGSLAAPSVPAPAVSAPQPAAAAVRATPVSTPKALPPGLAAATESLPSAPVGLPVRPVDSASALPPHRSAGAHPQPTHDEVAQLALVQTMELMKTKEENAKLVKALADSEAKCAELQSREKEKTELTMQNKQLKLTIAELGTQVAKAHMDQQGLLARVRELEAFVVQLQGQLASK